MQPNSRLNESALAILLFTACSLPAQVVVGSGRQLQVPAPDATSAVSLDLHVADVSLNAGQLTIHGVDTGDTVVVALGNNGPREIPVHVTPSPPQYPPGFAPPEDESSQAGSYEARYVSDRNQVENIVDFASQSGAGLSQFHLATATLPEVPGHRIYIPSLFYRVATSKNDVTLFDQSVNDSPLTIQNVVVRGLHLKEDGWNFHAGYTVSADFANVFIPTEQEIAAGVTHATHFGDFLTIAPGILFLRSVDLSNGLQRSAWIASLLASLDFDTWHLRVEVAGSRGPAYAAELHHDSDKTNLHAHFVERRLDFPSLRTSGLPGTNADFSWTQNFSSRWSLLSAASVSRVDLITSRQDTESALANLRYRFARAWSVATGADYGSFMTAGEFSEKTLSLPQSVNFDTTHFGAGFQYQFSTASDSFSNGNGFRQSTRFNPGRFQITQYIDYQRDALSITELMSQLPGLQVELQKLGISAVTPDQLAAVLQEATVLRILGFANAGQIITVPTRVQEGGSLTWISGGRRPHQLNLSILADHNEFLTHDSHDYSVTGAYSGNISPGNQVQIAGSVIRSDFTGAPMVSPLLSASFRHVFLRQPRMWVAKNFSITGMVFLDPLRRGRYRPGMETVPRALISLDGQRTVLTDPAGHFRFKDVSPGAHRVELRYDPPRDHCFTSPRDTVVSAGDDVSFGIAFPKNDLWGFVEDDASNGMANVKVQITSASSQAVVTTDSAGKFLLPDVEPGRYQAQIDPESVALGYSTEDLAPLTVSVEPASFVHPVLRIPAERLLTGTVTVYDSAAGKYVPVADAVVSIPGLNRSFTTKSSGVFTFAGLPPGDIEISLTAGRSSLKHTITLPAQPVTLRDDFRISSLTGQVAATVASASQ